MNTKKKIPGWGIVLIVIGVVVVLAGALLIGPYNNMVTLEENVQPGRQIFKAPYNLVWIRSTS